MQRQDMICDPWLGIWAVSYFGEARGELKLWYDRNRLIGTFCNVPMENIWVMLMNDFGRTILSAEVPVNGTPSSIVFCMQELAASMIWGASEAADGYTRGLWTGTRVNRDI